MANWQSYSFAFVADYIYMSNIMDHEHGCLVVSDLSSIAHACVLILDLIKWSAYKKSHQHSRKKKRHNK